MKKIMFCAAVAALAAACTNEDDLVLNQEKGSKGLTFDVSLAENAVTRGELWRDDNGTYPFFWYAEQDEINVQSVYAVEVNTGYGANSTKKGVATFTDINASGDWSLTNGAAVYKATVSAGNGQFTAKSSADMLALPDYDDTNAGTIAATTPTIVATYGINVKSVTSNTTGTTKRQVPGSLKKLVLTTSSSNATQTLDRPNQVEAPMYSVSSAKKEEAYDSFGEKAQLQMIRPFPVVRFTTRGTDEYIDDLGNLVSVTLTMLGENARSSALPESSIAYASGKDYTVIGGENELGAGTGFIAGTSDKAVTVSVTNGEWSDDDAIYMTVAPVDRKAFRTKGAKESIKIEYVFDNITFTLDPTRDGAADFEKLLVTDNDWKAVTADGAPNAITPLPALDINNYNYLVTGSAGNYTLIVIKGTFGGAFLANGNVNWGDGSITKAAVKKIRSDVALTADELAMLKDFTNLEELELKANTVIPAGTFSNGQLGTIEKLILPAVTEIKSNFFVEGGSKYFTKLTDLNLAAYNFPDATINSSFFNSTKTTLENLNIASVQTMLPTFGVERELLFKNFTKLETVKVYNGVQLSASAFEGCDKLKKVEGKVNVTGAVNAFAMLSAGNSALKAIEITGTDIPNGAFKNCTALKTVKVNGAQVAPTSVGESAFEGCTEMKYMSLANVTTMGKAAFKTAGLISDSSTSQVLTVGAGVITEEALSGTKVVMVDFTNATSIEPKILAGTKTTLKQVRFNQVFTGVSQTATGMWATTFGDTGSDASTVVLFVAAGQTQISSNKLGLPWYDASSKTTKYDEYSFKGIYRN